METAQTLLVSAALSVGLLSSSGAAQAVLHATNYSIDYQQVLQQTDSNTIVTGYSPFTYDQFALVAKVDTGGANLSAAPILGLPSPTASFPTGIITFPTTGTSLSPTWATGSGYNRYQYASGWTSTALLNNNFGSGTFTFTLGNATAQPTLPLDTVTPLFPVTPMLSSGGTWSGGALLIDPTVGATLNFNSSSFTTYSSGVGGQISFQLFSSIGYPDTIVPPTKSLYASTLGKFDTALSSLTIAPGTLTAGKTYTVQANFTQFEDINTTSFTGTGISGNPVGLSHYTTSTFITIETVPLPSAWSMLASGASLLLPVLRRRIKA